MLDGEYPISCFQINPYCVFPFGVFRDGEGVAPKLIWAILVSLSTDWVIPSAATCVFGRKTITVDFAPNGFI